MERSVNVTVVRLPQVHSPVKLGFISQLVRAARTKGVSAYVGDGSNRWAAVALSDAVRLYRFAMEKAAPGARYNAVAEPGVELRQIAATIGAGLGVPVRSLSQEEAKDHFAWFAMFAGMDMTASSVETQQLLNWKPSGPSLLQDLTASAR